MIRQAPRHLLRCSRPLHAPQTRRFLSTAPPAQKSRSWKSSAVRWGLAIGVVYYYNTSNLFAEEPPCEFLSYAKTNRMQLMRDFSRSTTPPIPHRRNPSPHSRIHRLLAPPTNPTLSPFPSNHRTINPNHRPPNHQPLQPIRSRIRSLPRRRLQRRNRRHKLGLPLPRRHGPRSLRRAIQSRVFMLCVFQGGGQGDGLYTAF